MRKYLADGRLVVAAAIGIYWCIYFVGIYKYNFNTIRLYQVPVMVPNFADLRSITSAYDCARLNYDPMVYNTCDPFQRPFNYPRIWMVFSSLGITQKHTNTIGIILALVFYICLVSSVIPAINRKTSIIYILAALSPAAVLGVERGNSDLIIFVILALVLLGLKKSRLSTNIVSYSLILLCSILKLYPIFALTTLLKEKRKLCLIVLCLCVFVFLGYLVLTYDDLVMINKNTPKLVGSSYGSMIIFDYYATLVTDLSKINPHLLKTLARLASLILSFVTIILAISSYDRLKQNGKYFTCNYIDGFRIGSSIYIGTFLLGYNFYYRLIFLLFCIPQLIEWSKLKSNISLSHITLFLIVISMWAYVWVNPTNPLPRTVTEGVNWVIFFSLTSFLLLTLPEWLRKTLDLKIQWLKLHKTGP